MTGKLSARDRSRFRSMIESIIDRSPRALNFPLPLPLDTPTAKRLVNHPHLSWEELQKTMKYVDVSKARDLALELRINYKTTMQFSLPLGESMSLPTVYAHRTRPPLSLIEEEHELFPVLAAWWTDYKELVHKANIAKQKAIRFLDAASTSGQLLTAFPPFKQFISSREMPFLSGYKKRSALNVELQTIADDPIGQAELQEMLSRGALIGAAGLSEIYLNPRRVDRVKRKPQSDEVGGRGDTEGDFEDPD